ncbi:hypothetical protein [Saccharopolyspora spinosa]
MADVDGVQVPQGAADAGVMLGGGAYGEFVATELRSWGRMPGTMLRLPGV